MTPRPSRTPAPHAPASGFSLIEVLVAFVVFAIGVLALAVVIPTGTNRIGRAGRQTTASTLAAQRAELLLTTPYGNDDLLAGAHTDANNPLNTRYYVQWTVTDNQPDTLCKRVLVQVSRGSVSNTAEASVTIVCPQSGG
jgi:prepilin-type N-terminal cleavage/methylation domain-containing protein